MNWIKNYIDFLYPAAAIALLLVGLMAVQP